MFEFVKGMFGSGAFSSVANKLDDWKFTEEERSKFFLKYLEAIPDGFAQAQRVIGVELITAFVLMVLVTFGMIVAGLDTERAEAFIVDSMNVPVTVVLTLFFGGGTLRSLKK